LPASPRGSTRAARHRLRVVTGRRSPGCRP
jgi:hypothetical protein